jgi:thiol-disulfide isomerase/thioredoxin
MVWIVTWLVLAAVQSVRAVTPDELFDRLKVARAQQYAWQQWPATTDAEKSARGAERVRANQAVAEAAGAFLSAAPDDVRKWEVWSTLINAERRFSGPLASADERAWQALRREITHQILESPAVPDAVWERAMLGEIMSARRGVEEERKLKGTFDPAPWRATLDRLAARVPESRILGAFEGHYADFLLEQSSEEGERFLQRLTSSRNAQVAGMAKGKLNVLALARGPLELSFTAADGRSVDVAKLRGKVVIIDFWATWCVPCLKEFPNTKAAYEAYKAHGVEMLAISFDHAPKDPAKPTKSDRTREQFLADAARLGMDWPQYYDGLGWDCALGRQFNIVSIPRVWVLNKEGVLQTQFAEGRTLWDLLAKLTGHTAEIPVEFQRGDRKS